MREHNASFDWPDTDPDGERIIAIRPEGSSGWNRLNVVLNWFPEPERLAPVN